MLHVFAGYDAREAIGWTVFQHSLLTRAAPGVALHMLGNQGMRQGTNAFTLSRFLVPHLMGNTGWALFLDGADMLVTCDVTEILRHVDDRYAVLVVKHDYVTRHPRKYVGTSMECDNRQYPRKNWASVMLINCGHMAWRRLGPQALHEPGAFGVALTFAWLHNDEIGALPDRWNRLVDEGQPVEGASVLHWTAGVPGMPAYAAAPGAELWRSELSAAMRAP